MVEYCPEKDNTFCCFSLIANKHDNIFTISTTDRKHENKSIAFQTITIKNTHELTRAITNDWSPIVWYNGIRKGINFVSCQLLVLDIDNEPDEPQLSIKSAHDFLESYKLKYVIATSRNHQQSKNNRVVDRFRIILFLDKPITDPLIYLQTYNKLLDELEQYGIFADKACKDTARFYYATPNVHSIGNDGYLLVAPAMKTPTLETTNTTSIYSETVKPGRRNSTLFVEAACAKDLKISMEYFIEVKRDRYAGLSDNEFNATVASAYNRPQKKSGVKVAKTDYKKTIDDYMQKNNLIYFRNEIDGQVFFEGKSSKNFEAVVAKIATSMLTDGYTIPRAWIRDIVRVILEDNERNLLKEWIEKNNWTQNKDYLREFFDCITIDHNEDGELVVEKYQDLHNRYFIYFKRWMIATVGRIYGNGITNSILILHGKQGIGKTRLIQKISSAMPCGFFSGAMDPSDKDHRLKTTKCVIWFIDEFDQITKKSDIAAIKDMATAECVTEREPYATNEVTRRVTASFVGSTNSTTFLTDRTGSRRYRIIPIKGIEVSDKLNPHFIQQMFAQAKALYEMGMQYWYDNEENDLIDIKDNSNYKAWSLVDHIMSYIESGNDILNCIEIINAVDKSSAARTRQNCSDLKSELERRGFKYLTYYHLGVPKKGFKVSLYKLKSHSLD